MANEVWPAKPQVHKIHASLPRERERERERPSTSAPLFSRFTFFLRYCSTCTLRFIALVSLGILPFVSPLFFFLSFFLSFFSFFFTHSLSFVYDPRTASALYDVTLFVLSPPPAALSFPRGFSYRVYFSEQIPSLFRLCPLCFSFARVTCSLCDAYFFFFFVSFVSSFIFGRPAVVVAIEIHVDCETIRNREVEADRGRENS